MHLLKKYRISIIYILGVSILAFWYIPIQEDLYERAEFARLKAFSLSVTLIVASTGFVILLVYAGGGLKNVFQAGLVLLWAAVIAISFYFFTQTFFLAGCLAVNSIPQQEKVYTKYVVHVFSDGKTPLHLIYDLNTKQTSVFHTLANSKQLLNAQFRDTVIISFDKGLLGFKLNPAVTDILQPTMGLAQWRDRMIPDRYNIFELLNMGWSLVTRTIATAPSPGRWLQYELSNEISDFNYLYSWSINSSFLVRADATRFV